MHWITIIMVLICLSQNEQTDIWFGWVTRVESASFDPILLTTCESQVCS